MFDTSAFAQALVQQQLASMDPMRNLVLQQFKDSAQDRELSRDHNRIEFIEKIELKLMTAIERKAPQAIISAYVKMLEKTTGQTINVEDYTLSS